MNIMLFVMVGAGFFALIIWLGVTQARKARDNLRRLAEQLGLQTDVGKEGAAMLAPLQARGLVDGRLTELYTFTKGSGKSRSHWCGLRVQPKVAATLEFDFSPQGMGSKMLGWFGVKEITVGNQAFDDAFFVRTNEPDLLRAGLVPDLQAKLLAGQQAGLRGTFKLVEGVLTYVEQGTFVSDALCTRFGRAGDVIRHLADLAEVVAGA